MLVGLRAYSRGCTLVSKPGGGYGEKKQGPLQGVMEQEHFEKQVSGESPNPLNRRAECLAEWVGLAVGGLLAAGVWLGSERDGLKFATELGVCAFFGFLAYLVVLGIGRFVIEGRPFLARTLYSFLIVPILFLLLAGIFLAAIVGLAAAAFVVWILPPQNDVVTASIAILVAFAAAIGTLFGALPAAISKIATKVAQGLGD